MEDYWRPIEGYPGYRVSRNGEVESCWNRKKRPHSMTHAWKPINASRNSWGYFYVNLRNDEKRVKRMVHHLVLEAFVVSRPSGMICCHNDGVPGNNRLSNLRWNTHQSNTQDKIKHGTQPRGERMNTAKLKESEVLEIRQAWSEGVPIPSLARSFGVRPGTIKKVVERRSWTHLP